MAPIGPKYLPCSAIAAWRCFTSVSGFTCAEACNATPAPRASAIAPIRTLFFIHFSSERTFHDQNDGDERQHEQGQRPPGTYEPCGGNPRGIVSFEFLHAREHRSDQVFFLHEDM